MWKKLLNKYRPYLVFFVILFVAAGIFLVSGNKGSETAKNTAILEIMQPWQKLTAKMGSASSYVCNSVLSFIYLKQDNDKLNKELSNLAYQNNRLAEEEKENERLKRLLDYKKKVNFKTGMAKVVGRDISNFFGILTVDLGERDGVVRDMPVITPDGVVGKIIEVYPEYSLVMLLTDYKSGISGVIQKTRIVGAINGAGNGLCKMKYLSINEEVKAGDLLVTSGDGKFPKGLLIGQVSGLKPAADSMSLDINVIPAVNVLKLEEVLIVFKE